MTAYKLEMQKLVAESILEIIFQYKRELYGQAL
jgi:hypothetical protein